MKYIVIVISFLWIGSMQSLNGQISIETRKGKLKKYLKLPEKLKETSGFVAHAYSTRYLDLHIYTYTYSVYTHLFTTCVKSVSPLP